MEKQIRTVNLASLLTATILFLLPWTNVTCAGEKLASQSGLQAAYGGVSAGAGADLNQTTRANVHDSDLSASALVAIALAAVLAGAAISLLVVMNRPAPKIAPGVFALIAFGLLGLAAAIGFPIDDVINAVQVPAVEKDSLGIRVTGAFPNTIAAERTPWFWLELVALAIPAALYLRRRFTASPAPPAAAAPASPPS